MADQLAALFGNSIITLVSELREVNKPQPPLGILLSTIPLYNRDETKYVIILLKKLTL